MPLWYLRIKVGWYPSQLVTFAPDARTARRQMLQDLQTLRVHNDQHPITDDDPYKRAEQWNERNNQAPILDASGPYAANLEPDRAVEVKTKRSIHDSSEKEYVWKYAESLEQAVQIGWLYKAPRTIWWSALDG